MPGYRHDYSKFYQLPNCNSFTHRLLFFSREATSEIYGPRVSSLLYLPLRSIFICYCFQMYISKTQKYLAVVYFNLILFEIYLSNLSYFSPVYLPVSGAVARKGLTTPLIRRVASICYLCAGAVHVVLRGSPTGSIRPTPPCDPKRTSVLSGFCPFA